MATLNVITTFLGVAPFDVSVTAANLNAELSLKDFVVVNTSSNIQEDLTHWTKISQTLIRYTGGSSTLISGNILEIRRKTPNLIVQNIAYATRFSSDVWNKEVDRIIRWREEADYNGIGPNALLFPNKGVQNNKLINGRFKIWQLGGSFGPVGGGAAEYKISPTADMWGVSTYDAAVAPTYSVARQLFALNTTDIPPFNPKYFMRINVINVGSGYGGGHVMRLFTQNTDAHEFIGKTVTLSGYFRSSIASKILGIRVLRVSGVGGSFSQDVFSGTWTLTNTFQRYSKTFTMPSTAGVTGTEGTDTLIIFFVMSSTAGEIPANVPIGGTGTTDFSDIQLELGSTATSIQDKTFTEEFTNCQRYLQRSGAYGTVLGSGANGYYAEYPFSGTGNWGNVQHFFLPMRKAPGVVIYSQAGTAGSMSRAGVNSTPNVSGITTDSFFIGNNNNTSASTFYYDWVAYAFE